MDTSPKASAIMTVFVSCVAQPVQNFIGTTKNSVTHTPSILIHWNLSHPKIPLYYHPGLSTYTTNLIKQMAQLLSTAAEKLSLGGDAGRMYLV